MSHLKVPPSPNLVNFCDFDHFKVPLPPLRIETSEELWHCGDFADYRLTMIAICILEYMCLCCYCWAYQTWCIWIGFFNAGNFLSYDRSYNRVISAWDLIHGNQGISSILFQNSGSRTPPSNLITPPSLSTCSLFYAQRPSFITIDVRSIAYPRVRVFHWDHVHLTGQRDVKAHYSWPSRLHRKRDKMTSRRWRSNVGA